MADIDTKALKRSRETLLVDFLEGIKSDGTWRQWLNDSGGLHIACVCKYLGAAEEKGLPWDSTCFRGGKWAETHKEDFNKWVRHKLETALADQDTDLFGSPLRNSIMLPPSLNFEGLPDEMIGFIKDKLAEVKRLKERVAALESLLNIKDRKVLELQTQMDSIIEAGRARDDHFMFSIRSLKYD